MRTLLATVLWLIVSFSAHADAISKERQAYLEGVWSGISTEVNANKLCSRTEPPAEATALAIEFLRSGGVAFVDDGTEAASRSAISAMSEENGIVSLTINGQAWRFRADTKDVMYRVRSSASLGGDVDTMVFKRCKPAADRSAVSLDELALKFFAADLPGDEAFFIDERHAAKSGNRCSVQETQYLFFVLIGPSEFRVSRWNSFAIADKLAVKKPVKLPLDRVADWLIEEASGDSNKLVIRMRDYEDEKAKAVTITLEARADSITIPEWKRTYIRCKGFQSRS